MTITVTVVSTFGANCKIKDFFVDGGRHPIDLPTPTSYFLSS